ncbi:unnamed protein product [Effrenium voratum]|uniref:Uncharacterized protein n=1 Tax=Effrenium voratum TaxID=2562239 RepID=A0AA36I1R6_9DINO|nr:unnamed protein product [Effrenium voratum]CAJ1447107.1 unnamed protein product [Effrenium voratum]
MPLSPMPVTALEEVEAKVSVPDGAGAAEAQGAEKPDTPETAKTADEPEDAEKPEAPDTSKAADAVDANAADEDEKDAEDVKEKDEVKDSEKPRRKAGLRARVLAELKSASPLDMMARLEAELAEHDGLIAAARAAEAAKQLLVEEAMVEVERESQVVKAAEEIEAQALTRVKDLQKRKREAAKKVAERKKEVQHQEDLLVLLGFEVERRRKLQEAEASAESEQDAKRQKIQELLQVAEEAKKAQDEMRQREKEARQAVRQLEKEQKQRLGPFGRRVARKAKAAEVEKTPAPEPASGEQGAVVNLVPVKCEAALRPFPARAEMTEKLIISIEDSQ